MGEEIRQPQGVRMIFQATNLDQRGLAVGPDRQRPKMHLMRSEPLSFLRHVGGFVIGLVRE